MTIFNTIFNDKSIILFIKFLLFNNKKLILAYQMALCIGVQTQIQC